MTKTKIRTRIEFVRPETLSTTHICDGEEVVTGGDDGQVWVATFACPITAQQFIGRQKSRMEATAGQRTIREAV